MLMCVTGQPCGTRANCSCKNCKKWASAGQSYNQRIAAEREQLIRKIGENSPEFDPRLLETFAKEHGNEALRDVLDTLNRSARFARLFTM